MTRDQIVEALVSRKVRRTIAVMYADAVIEYQLAAAHIAEHGTIVQHPRTGNPIENPYLKIRDRAMVKLRAMDDVKGDFLWEREASE